MVLLENSKYDSTDIVGRNKLVLGWEDHFAAGIAGNKEGTNQTGIVLITENGFNTEFDAVVIDSVGNTSITGSLACGNIPVYANNAAALVGGLVAGDFYKTASTGDATLMITNAT